MEITKHRGYNGKNPISIPQETFLFFFDLHHHMTCRFAAGKKFHCFFKAEVHAWTLSKQGAQTKALGHWCGVLIKGFRYFQITKIYHIPNKHAMDGVCIYSRVPLLGPKMQSHGIEWKGINNGLLPSRVFIKKGLFI